MALVKFDCKSRLTPEEFVTLKDTLRIKKPSDDELRITFTLVVKSTKYDLEEIDDGRKGDLIEYMIRRFQSKQNIPIRGRMFFCADWIEAFFICKS